MFHPFGPNLLRSITVEWKKQRPNRIDLILGSLSSISSLEKNYHALFMFARRPAGGSFVNLIDLSRIPIGIPSDGSADKNNLNFGLPPPASPVKLSRIFSSSNNHVGIKWMFYNITQ
jgi:hypothetical protein